MIIYLDQEYKCYLSDNGSRRAVETDVFNGKPRKFIEGYRYVPAGETWVREDGEAFHGLMVSAAIPYETIMQNEALDFLDDDEAEMVTGIFPSWDSGMWYEVGDRQQFDGLLYRCVQAHTSQEGWEPPAVPALWVRTSTEEWPEWIQPTGAQDAYQKDDKVSHNGSHWISDVDGNVWEPGVYGWSEANG